MAGRLLLVTLEAARVDAAHPVSARLSPVRAHRGRHGAPGLRSPTHARLARDLLHDRDGAPAYERDGHRVGAHYADKILKGAPNPVSYRYTWRVRVRRESSSSTFANSRRRDR